MSEERELVSSAAAGDAGAFEELVRRHAPRVRALCLSMLRDEAEADDAAQEAFLKAWRKLSSFGGESSFATWLHRIAANQCLDALRVRARRRSEPLEAAPEPASPSGAAALEAADLAARLLAALPEDQRLALTLRELQGLSYEEIAAVMECSLDSVKARLRRARRTLEDAARHFPGPGIV